MRPILSRRNRPVLKRFAQTGTLLGLDFDGTLAPIVADRDRAAMRRSTRNLLTRVAKKYPCLVISGRSRRDVQRRLRGAGVQEVAGNHGIEPWSSSSAIARKVRAWLPRLRKSLRHLAGVEVEDKRFSIAVHYRGARRKAEAQAAIRAAARKLGRVRLIGGKRVVNILPAGMPNKGAALERRMRELACERAVYIGDDDTDEDAFALARRRSLLAVRVGRKRASRAPYYLRDQRDVDRFLQTLLLLRRE
jgi:trehalose 6-phosphate phosphatase